MGGKVVVVGGSTKFNVKHQVKDIHHPFFCFIFSWVDPMPFPFPELHNNTDEVSIFARPWYRSNRCDG